MQSHQIQEEAGQIKQHSTSVKQISRETILPLSPGLHYPQCSLQRNFNSIIKEEPPTPIQQPVNLLLHNLCKDNKTPPCTKQLLGRNLKYCLASGTIRNDINDTVKKMAYSIQTHYNLKALGLNTKSEFIKQIFVWNKNWNPEPAPHHIEEKITQFEKQLKARQNQLIAKHTNSNLRNLTMQQSLTLWGLKENNSLTVKPTDKNLGPVILDTNAYIRQILQEHLLTKDYNNCHPSQPNRCSGILLQILNLL